MSLINVTGNSMTIQQAMTIRKQCLWIILTGSQREILSTFTKVGRHAFVSVTTQAIIELTNAITSICRPFEIFHGGEAIDATTLVQAKTKIHFSHNVMPVCSALEEIDRFEFVSRNSCVRQQAETIIEFAVNILLIGT
jgi:hypothetical protein